MKSDKLINHLRAGFSLYWLKTHEANRVRSKIYQELKSFQRKDGRMYEISEWNAADQENVSKKIQQLLFEDKEVCNILFLYNFHWFIDKPQVIQTIQNAIPVMSNAANAIVIVSPKVSIPMELEKDTVLMEMDLPSEEEIVNKVKYVAPNEKVIPKNEELQKVVDSCKSLTEIELQQVLQLSLMETEGNHFSIEVINDYRSQAIQKTGFLQIIPGDITFDNVVGYKPFKQFVMETENHPEAKGVMAIGAPGCGKTSIMKAIVGETKRFGLALNMGKLFSKYQGETDANINKVIDIICALGRVFLLIDEFEKQFAGAESDGSLDSGTTRRATGRWLDFLDNRPKGIYVCGTANSFVGIPSEYLRPGRWDTSPFYIGLPNQETRLAILKYYMKKKGLKDKKLPDLKGFTGSEIESLCHISSMRNLPLTKAVSCIIPQSRAMKDKLEKMNMWAKDNCISAEEIIDGKHTPMKAKLDL